MANKTSKPAEPIEAPVEAAPVIEAAAEAPVEPEAALVVDSQPQVKPENGEKTPSVEPTAPDLPTEDKMADAEALPDADLLRNLVANINRRNNPRHRDALWSELLTLGGAQDGFRFTLAGITATGEGTHASMMTNWANAARRKLLEIGA